MKKQLYKCEDCGLHYEDKETADACYDFCTKNHACNVEITKNSIEHKRLMKQRAEE